jgi:hypothetical protein
MTRARKPPELLPGETYALAFRRVAEELRLLRNVRWLARLGERLRGKVKRTEELLRALQRYCDAREEVEMGRAAAARREAAWAQLRYELQTYNRSELNSQLMTRVRRQERKEDYYQSTIGKKRIID